MGTSRRYISMSSPWSHSFIEENMIIEGSSEIEEYFSMGNLDLGVTESLDWRDLF